MPGKPFGQRGDIYSIDQKIISTTGITYDAYWDTYTPYMSKNPELIEDKLSDLADSLANFLGRPRDEVYQFLLNSHHKKHHYVKIATNLNISQAQRLKNFPIFNLGRYRGGLILHPIKRRIHPFGQLAYRAIGEYKYSKFGDERQRPLFGIEYYYNSQLQGKQGIVVYRKGPGSINFIDKVIIPPEDGIDLISTIDMNIQYYLHNALIRRLKELKAEHGVGIIMDVKTGEIKAMSNLQLYPKDSSYYETRNFAVQWAYEPGSVMKPLSMIALFETYPHLSLNMPVNTGTGEYHVKDHVFRDDKKGGYGTLTLQGVIEHSSNVGVVKVILKYFKHNPQIFINRLINIGIERKTGIDLAGETDHPIKDTTTKTWWDEVSLGQLAIGYEHRMTPLQILALYNAIANDGLYITPHLVYGYRENGEIIKQHFNYERGSIASQATINKVKEMLEGVVLRGTASRTVKSDIVSIAGKTGTAQIYDPEKKAYLQKYNTTFVGYFPADKPRYSMIIVISKPTKNRSGALAAGPVFREVAEKIIQYETTNQSPQDYIVNFWAKKTDLPEVKSGFRRPIINLINHYKIPHTDKSDNSKWIRVITKSDYLELENYYYKQNTTYYTLTMSPLDAAYVMSKVGYKTQMYGVGAVASEKKLKDKTVKLNLR